MKPLRVLLIHRDNCNYRQLTGWWSHPVLEFEWETMAVPASDFKLSLLGTSRRYDLVIVDDWIFGQVSNKELPIGYVIVDSARSEMQLKRNKDQAQRMGANILLIDSDELGKFGDVRVPVVRFAHCVNSNAFYPEEKTYDVAFLCWPTDPRIEVREQLRSFCAQRGYSFLNGTYPNPLEYARAIRSARIVVHMAHVVEGRSWRIFDVMASKGCLLSNHTVDVSGDEIASGAHYIPWEGCEDLKASIDLLMSNPPMRDAIAKEGYYLVQQKHIWSVRAAQLREILARELSL